MKNIKPDFTSKAWVWPPGGVKMSKFNFFRTCSYLIKGMHEFSNMVVNILPADPHPDTGGEALWSKFNLFQYMVMLHIKIMGLRMRQHGSKYFAHRPRHPHPSPPLGPRGQKVKLSFFGSLSLWPCCILN